MNELLAVWCFMLALSVVVAIIAMRSGEPRRELLAGILGFQLLLVVFFLGSIAWGWIVGGMMWVGDRVGILWFLCGILFLAFWPALFNAVRDRIRRRS